MTRFTCSGSSVGISNMDPGMIKKIDTVLDG